ncbi:tetratricopeptide repeat protein [Microbulbifer discodermiae]|uniref:tetratricopeptide repeat protein n=1 Tax=Microbulbifer sp. 2201CG32-9 TaxID=3232309 RepID=UPI00345B5AEC
MKTLLQIWMKSSLLTIVLVNTSLKAKSNEIGDITNAYLARDIVALEEIKAQLPSELSYEVAYVNYRLALTLMLNEKKADAEILLNKAEAILTEREVENSSLDYSLLASVYSLKAGMGMFSGPVNGKKSSDSILKAQKLDRQNPQIWLVKGLSAYHTPKVFGGSDNKAIQFFNKAIALYSNDMDRAVYWGLEEALVWRAILHKKNGHEEEAIKDLERALHYRKNFPWAKELLVKFSTKKELPL